MDAFRVSVLMVGIFILAYGLAAYRFFHAILGGAAGMAAAILLRPTIVAWPLMARYPNETTLVLLVLFLVAGVLLVHFLRKGVVFLGGMAAGIVLSHFVTRGLQAADIFARLPVLREIAPVDLLVGILLGVLFVLFESIFALVLTSFAGAFLCAWALGGKWTFLAAMAVGLAVQPLLARFVPLPAHSAGGKSGGGKRKDKPGE